MASGSKRLGQHLFYGAYGERLVESELLRNHWTPSNVNWSVKNSPSIDILAFKADTFIKVQVKTCQPELNEFQWQFDPKKKIDPGAHGTDHFTVLVAMGRDRKSDRCFVLPTRVVFERLKMWAKEYENTPKRDGGQHLSNGHWTLRLHKLRSGEDRLNYGLEVTWAGYLEAWDRLDK